MLRCLISASIIIVILYPFFGENLFEKKSKMSARNDTSQHKISFEKKFLQCIFSSCCHETMLARFVLQRLMTVHSCFVFRRTGCIPHFINEQRNRQANKHETCIKNAKASSRTFCHQISALSLSPTRLPRRKWRRALIGTLRSIILI